MDKQEDGERQQEEEEEGMEVERRKLPKHYANQVSGEAVWQPKHATPMSSRGQRSSTPTALSSQRFYVKSISKSEFPSMPREDNQVSDSHLAHAVRVAGGRPTRSGQRLADGGLSCGEKISNCCLQGKPP